MEFSTKNIKWTQTENERISEQESHDRLSSLPSEILDHILSFLSMNEVVKTGVLSRKWRYFWHSTPCLNFDFRDFWNQERCLNLSYNECAIKFWVFVKCAIVIRSPICRLRLYCEACDTIQLDSLLYLCTLKEVQELDIFTGYGILQCPVHCGVPTHVDAFTQGVDSLVKLQPLATFSNLKTLNLVGIQFDGSDIAENLFSDCGVLETLSLEYCCFVTIDYLKISANKLRTLNFVNNGPYWWDYTCMFDGELELHTPNLVSFWYIGPVLHLSQSSDMLFLKNASIELRYQNTPGDLGAMVFSIRHVQELSVSPNFVTYHCPGVKKDAGDFCPLDSLRSLKVYMEFEGDHIEGLIKLLQHSRNLETLCIRFTEDPWKINWESRKIDVSMISHKLKEIEIFTGGNLENLLELIRFFLENGKSLEKINITQKKETLAPEKFYTLHNIQLACELVSISVGLAYASGTIKMFDLLFWKCGSGMAGQSIEYDP
ncbi:F-box/LRR-repeat protein At4g14103-like [Salvia splendens]|uniref:F-box/LRR-repeat protein At4g14103-like n=1 Tax=Salvia splendens TaxID=180675 RepID=UPI001C2662E0|nr:F-box/LRR-repeat protein At4g14103-like [Salvia splendens]XP_042027449.1 F-box/LRR-repeat protein At4g14103-like [Salvia splendens]XP_042027450.1 F-box/LRR-repeat protein At4g14103-like [Salvia splendens]XP_042027451.1 F-box/LRR-repeat protein At4g14103-like [Salvia splendens]